MNAGVERFLQARAAAPAPAHRLTTTQLAIVAFSRFEMDVAELRATLRAAGWSTDQSERLIASARANLRRVQA